MCCLSLLLKRLFYSALQRSLFENVPIFFSSLQLFNEPVLIRCKLRRWICPGLHVKYLFFVNFDEQCSPLCGCRVTRKRYIRVSQTFSGHVPLQQFDRWACIPEHGRRKDFFQAGAKNGFFRSGPKIYLVGQKRQNFIFTTQAKKTTFLQKHLLENVKIQNPGGALPHFWRLCP